MTTSMQGSWTVKVKSKSATWAQRFRIAGSSNGKDGVYAGETATAAVFVTGNPWGITVEHNPTGTSDWRASRQRMAGFRVDGGQFLFEIRSDDGGGQDTDYNDLVLECSMPLSDSEYVIYGEVKSHSGLCLFNPCYPKPFYVIDQPWALKEILSNAAARKVLASFYPERVRRDVRGLDRDEAFRPLMIPTGLGDDPGVVVKGRDLTRVVKEAEASRTSERQPTNLRVATPSVSRISMPTLRNAASLRARLPGTLPLVRDRVDVRALANLQKLVLRQCKVRPVAETLLRFVEYDRTDAEKLGSPYTGEGAREVLGHAATDEFGSYVFRFSWSYAQMAGEPGDVTSTEDVAAGVRPDVIVQILEELPEGVIYETAPHFDIANVRRINLCIPQSALGRPVTACQGGRAIQAIGDIFIVPHAGTTLHADGTISNTGPSGPAVDHAAWRGTLDLYACFLDTNPKVTHCTIRYRRAGEASWSFVNEGYSHLKRQADGTWASETVGPHQVSLRVNGPASPKQTVDAYLNIESDTQWLNTHRDRKVRLNTLRYQAIEGAVEFKLEGYDASGERVPGAEDVVKLYLDNHASTGAIASITYGSQTFDECALIELPAANSPLTIKLRVDDPEGFLSSYALSVYHGSNDFTPTHDAATGQPVAASYQSVAPFRFYGTTLSAGADGHVEVNLIPVSGSWLPPGRSFCAFSFNLSSVDRTTDGKSTPGGRTLWRELIGISHPPS